jgi:putative oxidoreductase
MQTTTHRARHWSLIALRTLIVAVFFWHGMPKAFNWPGAVDKFIGFGLPGFLGPLTGIAEVIAGSLLLLGVVQRPALAILGVTILGALATVQIPRGITAGRSILWTTYPGAHHAPLDNDPALSSGDVSAPVT